jgi:cytochrome c oxidase subunit 2
LVAAEFRGMNERPIAAIAVVALTAFAACGDDDGDVPSGLSAAARRGAELADDNGCSACHGAGTVAPSFDGLYGSSVELDDGTTVIADDEYLARAITDPGAETVDGYDVSMPDNDLDDDEVASIVAYIRELGPDGPGDGT